MKVLRKMYGWIWKKARRRVAHVDGHEIEYVALPWWLLIGEPDARSYFPSGLGIVDHASGTSMIFVSGRRARSPFLEYTLYHELWEGMYVARKLTYVDISQLIVERGVLIFNDILHTAPELRDFPLNMAKIHLIDFLLKYQDKPHLFALMMELSLAKQEMNEEDYLAHLNRVYEYRV